MKLNKRRVNSRLNLKNESWELVEAVTKDDISA